MTAKAADVSPSAPLTEAKAVKHPLQSEWQLWYYRPDKARNWEENQLKVAQFKTVEDFWA